jgi:hypothetical protein
MVSTKWRERLTSQRYLLDKKCHDCPPISPHGISGLRFCTAFGRTLTTGLLFCWPVVQPWPSVARWPRWSTPLYLFLATLPCDALSAYLVFCDRVVLRFLREGSSSRRCFALGRSRDGRCSDVGLCNLYIFGNGGDYHNSASLAFSTAEFRTRPARLES